MFLEIKNKIEKELKSYIKSVDKSYSLSKISPLLYRKIKEFIGRKGKRARPILFVIGYLGFARRIAPCLYSSAVSIELLHDFMLVHDDIIDKSDTRRGEPSMHALLNRYLKGHKNIKFNGQDLTIVVGDVMFAMALHAFLSIKEEPLRKERALKKLIEAALYTGGGEFLELLYGITSIDKLKKEGIYKIYDLKTANYTFSSPLAIGATLGGASKFQIDNLYKYGTYLGRAFQIKDDIIGTFSDEAKIGKSTLTDLQEGKRTILIWYAYNHSGRKDKVYIKKILSKKNVTRSDLSKMKDIIRASGALDFARKEIACLIKKAKAVNSSSGMKPQYKKFLDTYPSKLLNL